MKVASGVLLPKQKRFAEAYVKHGHDVKKAAKEAGYSSVQLCRDMLSRNEKIKMYIKKLDEARDAVMGKVLSYTAMQSFQNLQLAQKLALETKKVGMYRGRVVNMGKDPDLTNFLKAEELKGKLAKLYGQDETSQAPTTVMNIIRYPSNSTAKGEEKSGK